MPRETNPRKAIPHLKAWRVYFLLSQAKLAEKAGMAETTVIRIEQGGTANDVTVLKLARALGIPVSKLVQEAPPEEVLANGAA